MISSIALGNFFEGFAISLLIGLLLGIEREHARIKINPILGPIFGVRTIVLLTLTGFIISYLSIYLGNFVIFYLGVAFAFMFTTSVYVVNAIKTGHTGATTFIAANLIFIAGTIVGLGGINNYIIAISIAIITTLFLASKRILLKWTKKLTYEEILAALKFGVIALVIYPILPDINMGPFNAFNLKQIWTIIFIVSGISFVSYILMKVFSKKGILITSLFGGAVSSSATVYYIANLIRNKKALFSYALSGVFLSQIGSFFSDFILIILISKSIELIKYLVMPYIVAFICLFIFTLLFYKTKNIENKEEIRIRSPFALKPAFEFGLIYTLFVFLSTILKIYVGKSSLLFISVITSLISSTAVIMSSLSLLANGTITTQMCLFMIIIACVISMLVKVFWVQIVKNVEFSLKVLIPFSLTSILVIAVSIIQFWIF